MWSARSLDSACWNRESIDAKKAASVLPDPVGAAMSACSPEQMAGQLAVWTSVGVPILSWNQRAMMGWNDCRGRQAALSLS